MRLEELTSTADLDSLLPDWWSLYERCPGATPFHSPDWLRSWWDDFGFGDLWILALREGDRLVGIAPLFIHPYRDGHQGLLRQVSPVGIGITDYTDFLFDPQYAASASEMILQHLVERRTIWDACDLQGLREGSPLLRAAAPPGLGLRLVMDQPCPLISLPKSPEEFVGSLSSNRRHSYQTARKKLQQLGPVSFEVAGSGSWIELLEALFRLHQSCRLDRNRPAIFGSAKLRRFHRRVGQAFLCRGWLRMTAMRIGPQIASVLYGFACGRRAYYYQSGFDSNLQKLSPGTAIMGYAIEHAILEGLTEVDLLRGKEPYKYWWGARDRQTYRLLLWH
jgi:CelD/BcsL family acetyltransferase involved in cellulose biosynthesis